MPTPPSPVICGEAWREQEHSCSPTPPAQLVQAPSQPPSFKQCDRRRHRRPRGRGTRVRGRLTLVAGLRVQAMPSYFNLIADGTTRSGG